MIARLTLVAAAPTPAQRALRFPVDGDAIEPLPPGRVGRVAAAVGRWTRAVRAPEVRSAQTARALGLDAEADDRLRAWGMGAWTGRSVTEVADHEPKAFAAWRTDPEGAAPGGEPFTALLTRVGEWVDVLDGDERIVAVADPAVIRAATVSVMHRGTMADAAHVAFWTLDVEPLSTTVIQRAQGSIRVRTVGAIS